MASSIRNIITLYGPLDEADRFIGRFMRGGMDAFVPLPAESNTFRDCNEVWGASPEYGDFEILSESAIVAGQLSHGSRPRLKSIDANWVNYNTFTVADHHEEIMTGDLSGFVRKDEPPVALIVFHTKWRFPSRWIEAVINAEYPRGLVLHMLSYDIMANLEMNAHGGSCEYFHSYTSVADARYVQSGHCSILVNTVSNPGPMEDGDYDEDADLPLIDAEGNEVSLPIEYLPPLAPATP